MVIQCGITPVRAFALLTEVMMNVGDSDLARLSMNTLRLKRMKKIIVLIFFTFSFVIYSQEIDDRNKKETVLDSDSSKANPNLTQSEIRMSKKMETSFGLASDTDNLYVVKIRYNFTPNFSIGYSHFHRKDILKNQEFLVFQLPSTDSYGLHNKSIDKSRELGLLNVRYYFFDKFPLYATGGIGRDFIGIRTQEYLHSTYYNSFFSYGQINIDTKPNYNYSLGIGFQWNFKTGFFLGFEFLKLSPLNQKKAASGITKASSPNDTTFDIRQYFLLSSIGMLSSQEYGSRIADFWIGYSFSL